MNLRGLLTKSNFLWTVSLYVLIVTLVDFYITRNFDNSIVFGRNSITDDGASYAFKTFQMRFGDSVASMQNADKLITSWWSRKDYLPESTQSYLSFYSEYSYSLYGPRLLFPLLAALSISYLGFFSFFVPIIISFIIIWYILISKINQNNPLLGLTIVLLLFTSNFFKKSVLAVHGVDILLCVFLLIYFKISVKPNLRLADRFLLILVAALGSLSRPSVHFWIILSAIELFRVVLTETKLARLNKFIKCTMALLPAITSLTLFIVLDSIWNSQETGKVMGVHPLFKGDLSILQSLQLIFRIILLDILTMSTKEITLFILALVSIFIAINFLYMSKTSTEFWEAMFFVGIIIGVCINTIIVSADTSGLRYWMPLFPIAAYFIINNQKKLELIAKGFYYRIND